MREALPGDNQTVGKFDDIQPVGSFSEAMDATYQLAQKDTFVMSKARSDAYSEAESNGQTPISPEEANRQYPGLEVPFNKPVNPMVARQIYDESMDRKDLEKRSMEGPDNALVSVSRFGAGMLAHVMDPVETGVGMIAGWGVGKAATALASRFAPGLVTAAEVLTKSGTTKTVTSLASKPLEFAAESSGNLVQSLATEPLNASTAQKEQRNYTSLDMMQNVAMNTFAGPLLMGTVKGLAKGGKYAFGKAGSFLADMSHDTKIKIAEKTVNNMMNDIKPNATLEKMQEHVARETDVRPRDLQGVEGPGATYTYEKAPNMEGKKIYISSATSDKAGANIIGDDFGEGTYVTDNPQVANAKTVGSIGDGTGSIIEGKLDSAKLLDLNESIPEDLHASFKSVLEAGGEDVNLENMTPKEVLDSIKDLMGKEKLPEDTLSAIKTELQAKGYDGYLHDGSSVADQEHSPHNSAVIWDAEKIKEEGVHAPDNRVVRKMTPEEIQAEARANTPEHVTLDNPAYEQFKSEHMLDDRPMQPDIAEIDKNVQETLAQIEDQKQQGFFNPEETKEIDRVMQEIKDLDLKDTFIKAASNCLVG